MKKTDRIAKSATRTFQMQQYETQERAVRSFIEACRDCMSPEQYRSYHSEAEKSAGDTMHIVEYLVYALRATQTKITPSLRKAIDAVIQECGIDRNRWTDLRELNYDAYWKKQYGYDD